MTVTEIREAIRVPISGGPMVVTGRSAEILVEAARAYADLLDRGEEAVALRKRSNEGRIACRLYVKKPGRYLVVRLGDAE